MLFVFLVAELVLLRVQCSKVQTFILDIKEHVDLIKDQKKLIADLTEVLDVLNRTIIEQVREGKNMKSSGERRISSTGTEG